MSAPEWRDQTAAVTAADARGWTEIAKAMNALVTPCPIRPRVWGFLWHPRQHRWVDCTSALNTMTYTTMDRCCDCGMVEFGSGL